MLSTIEHADVAQAAITMSAERAILIARERFPNLCANGILGRRFTGPAIDPAHVTVALTFLGGCRKTKIPAVHSFDLRRAVGGVSVGAVIVAAVALGFDVHSWSGVTDYAPHAMTNVDPCDVRR